MQVKTSRLLAIETLHQLNASTLPLPVLFQQLSSEQNIAPKDRNLAMNLIYGVLRQKQYLENLLAKLCKLPIKKIHPIVLPALQVGLYQIFFLDRIPDSAAVNETVKAVKKTKAPKRLHGFVNGVLRESIRQKSGLPLPDDPDKHGKPVLNHPEWLTGRWQKNFGKNQMLKICKENNRQQDLTLRVNRLLLTPEDLIARFKKHDIEATPGRYAPDAVILPDYQGAISALPGLSDNDFHVQGESAQLASLLLGPFKEQGSYLDGCAGLGGKTGHILELLQKCNGTLTAVEPESHRLEMLEKGIGHSHGDHNFTIFKGDIQQFCQNSTEKFDGILIDAPCSGTGVTGRHPDIRWRRTEEDIKRYAKVQKEILQQSSALLKAGGILVYATCSLEEEENEQVITSFLAENSGFTLSDCKAFLPHSASALIRNKFFHPLPSDLLDGFFAARLVCNSPHA